MKPTLASPTIVTASRSVNGAPLAGSGGGGTRCNGVTFVLQQRQAPRIAGVSVSTASSQSQQPDQLNGGFGGGGKGNGNGANANAIFSRFQNSNVIQVRRIITQRPQKLQQLQDSSESSVELQQSSRRGESSIRKRGIIRGYNEMDDDEDDVMDLEENESMDVDISIIRKEGGEDDDDEDLLVDHVVDDDVEDGDEGDGKEDGEKTAMEMNGASADPSHLRHVIETQIMNRHKTRIKDWDGSKGHMCQSCHESFLTEKGLEIHRNRRIHHILFSCRYCKGDLSFFNKCRLLQHLRNHRISPTVSSLQNCTMIRLLPESEYLHFKYEDCTSSSDEEDKESGGGTGSGGSSPPKRMKPSKFRKIARSSVYDDDGADSPDNSPPPIASKQQVAAGPQKTPSATTASLTISTSTNSANNGNISQASTNTASHAKPNTIGTIKYAGTGNTTEQVQQRSDQVTVIKSTGNTTSVILPSPAVKSVTPEVVTAPVLKKILPSPPSSTETPQIRIRNLSQITVDTNDDEEKDEPMDDHLEIQPVVPKRSQVVSAPITITNTSAEGGVASGASSNVPSASNSTGLTVQKSSQVIVAQQPESQKEYRCYKCEKDFTTGANLFQHLKEAEQVGLTSRTLHRCPTDDIPSWSQCQYVFHTKVFHEKLAPFICPGCGFEGIDFNSLSTHVTNDCFYASQRARYMCAASVQKCSFADKKSVKTEPEILDHLKKEHSRSVLQCVECPQGFATANWLLKHLSDAHKIHFDESKGAVEREALINRTTRPLIQCLICNILFPNVTTYLQHVYLNFHMHILHAKMFECQSCSAIFETSEEITSHQKQSEKCRRANVIETKLFGSTNEVAGASKTTTAAQLSVTPTPIKIIANPAALIATAITSNQQAQAQQHGGAQIKQQSQQQVSNLRVQPVNSPVITLIATPTTSNGNSTTSTQQQRSQQQHQQHSIIQLKPLAGATTSSFTGSSTMTTAPCLQSPSQPAQSAKRMDLNKIVHKKTFFEELLACQFCERLVLYSSLRKHEDQCCGLSTVSVGFCLTCRQNFGDSKTLARHGISHFKEGIPICLYCNNRHMRPTHPKSTIPTAHENLYALKKHIYSNHTSKPIQYPFQCPICDTICKEKRAVEFHIKDHHFKYKVSQDEPDPAPVPTSAEDLEKMVKVWRKGSDPRRKVGKQMEVYYCPVCKNREFAMESGLARHFKLVHQKNPKTLNLSRLKKPSTARRFVVKDNDGSPPTLIPQKPLLRSSVENKVKTVLNSKGITSSNRVLTRSTTTGSTSTNNSVTVTSSSAATSFTSRFTSSNVLRKRIPPTTIPAARKPVVVAQRQSTAPKQRASTDSSSTSRDARPPSNFLQTRSSKCARKRDGTIICHKCPDFVCNSIEEFYEHIKWKHVWSEAELEKLQYGNKAGMEEPSEFWCPECNTMFVAKPSLVKHLKFAHDYISNVDDYMKRIGYDGKKPVKPNQCDVCYLQCADNIEFQQHFRTHGMAFLRAQRQQRQQSTSK